MLIGAVLLTATGAIYYTMILSQNGELAVRPFALLSLTMASHMSWILAITVLFSSLFKNAVAAGGASFIGYILISITIGLLPLDIKQYLPTSFIEQAPLMLSGKSAASELVIPILVGLALSAVTIAFACIIAEKREI